MPSKLNGELAPQEMESTILLIIFLQISQGQLVCIPLLSLSTITAFLQHCSIW